jgi:predicted metal-dependent phosphoesterase TrpH
VAEALRAGVTTLGITDHDTLKGYDQAVPLAAEAGLELVELPLWYDVDDGPTLDILRAELLGGIAPGFATMAGYMAPHTREFLLALDSPPSAVPQDEAD